MPLTPQALTTLAQLRTELGLASDEGDASQLEARIERASAAIATYLGAPLHYQAGIVERVVGWGAQRLTVTRRPLRAVSEVALMILSTAEVVDADTYEIEDAAQGWLLKTGGTWAWTTAGVGLTPDGVAGQERQGYRVTYTGGWITPGLATGELVRDLPYDIEEACLQLAVLSWRTKGRDASIRERKLLSGSIKYGDTSEGAAGILASLDHYRRIV